MKAEDFRSEKTRPFTGAEYIASLRDGREVYINGERVTDVTTHPSMRNSVRSLARLYDALHDPAKKDVLTTPTDTGNGGYTHKLFKHASSVDDLVGQQGAITEWARMTYGWMGRTADYKASLMNTLNVNAEWYGDYADNARAWHKRTQESALFLNHAIVNPPIDRHKPAEHLKDVFVHVTKETDAGTPEDVRLQVLKGAEKGRALRDMEALVDTCMSDYDEHGWTGDTWLQPLDGRADAVRDAAE
ncbi:MAG TPA: hypothetical protein DDW73_11305 [Rhizobium sp.]|jgi:4-hydroxyphenylacetate 3-monooxygenase|nr:hypothetical protein [Rhizobium sp.]